MTEISDTAKLLCFFFDLSIAVTNIEKILNHEYKSVNNLTIRCSLRQLNYN